MAPGQPDGVFSIKLFHQIFSGYYKKKRAGNPALF